jgi:hypothetical protein
LQGRENGRVVTIGTTGVSPFFFSGSGDARGTFGVASGFSRRLKVPSTPSSIILKGSLSKQSRVKWVEHNL